MLRENEAPQRQTTMATCTPCTLGIHSCCTAHRSACRCEVARHPTVLLGVSPFRQGQRAAMSDECDHDWHRVKHDQHRELLTCTRCGSTQRV